MKTRVVFALVAIIIVLGIAYGVVRHFLPTIKTTQPITIRSTGSNSCKADKPRPDLSYENDKVQWKSEDNKYTVTFKYNDVVVSPPLPPWPPGYSPESPLAPGGDETVTFDKTNPSREYELKHKTKYYLYAIQDQSANTCRYSTDDSDTGLNVKR